MAALGFKVSLKKGARSTQMGRCAHLADRRPPHHGLPEASMSELVKMLKAWANRGMAPIKELRQVAGKAPWLSGICHVHVGWSASFIEYYIRDWPTSSLERRNDVEQDVYRRPRQIQLVARATVGASPELVGGLPRWTGHPRSTSSTAANTRRQQSSPTLAQKALNLAEFF